MASQTITGPDLQFTQDNKHCYGYSGQVNPSSGSVKTLFDFDSISGYMLVTFQFTFDKTSIGTGESFGYTVKINGITVARLETESSTALPSQPFDLNLLFPPLSAVLITADTDDSGGAFFCSGSITGRVYEHLPVRN